MSELHAVTGAFGFSGKYLVAELQRCGYRVREDYLLVDASPSGTTRFPEWLRANHDWLGMHYQNDLARRKM